MKALILISLLLTACGRQSAINPGIQAAQDGAEPTAAQTVPLVVTAPDTETITNPIPPDLSGYFQDGPPPNQIPTNGSRISPCMTGEIKHDC